MGRRRQGEREQVCKLVKISCPHRNSKPTCIPIFGIMQYRDLFMEQLKEIFCYQEPNCQFSLHNIILDAVCTPTTREGLGKPNSQDGQFQL